MSEHNQKHLTLSNRTYIEQELLQKSTFSSIGEVLHKDPSTISKEVKRYSKTVPAKHSYKCNLCKHYKECDLLSSELHCQSYHNRYCSFYCKRCYHRNPTNVCPYLKTCGTRYREGQAKIHLPGLLLQTGNGLRTRLVIPHGEIMRLLLIISASCMTANLFPSGQMICSNA